MQLCLDLAMTGCTKRDRQCVYTGNNIYRVSQKQDTLFLPITLANVDWFSKSFIFRLSSNCVTKRSLKI